MHDKIEVDETLGIINVNSYAEVTKENVIAAINEAKQIFADKGFYKVLLDTTNQDSMPNTVDIFKLFATFPKEFRMALLLNRNQKTEKDLSFAENVGVNRDFQMKIFYDKKSALQWLNNE